MKLSSTETDRDSLSLRRPLWGKGGIWFNEDPGLCMFVCVYVCEIESERENFLPLLPFFLCHFITHVMKGKHLNNISLNVLRHLLKSQMKNAAYHIWVKWKICICQTFWYFTSSRLWLSDLLPSHNKQKSHQIYAMILEQKPCRKNWSLHHSFSSYPIVRSLNKVWQPSKSQAVEKQIVADWMLLLG